MWPHQLVPHLKFGPGGHIGDRIIFCTNYHVYATDLALVLSTPNIDNVIMMKCLFDPYVAETIYIILLTLNCRIYISQSRQF